MSVPDNLLDSKLMRSNLQGYFLDLTYVDSLKYYNDTDTIVFRVGTDNKSSCEVANDIRKWMHDKLFRCRVTSYINKNHSKASSKYILCRLLDVSSADDILPLELMTNQYSVRLTPEDKFIQGALQVIDTSSDDRNFLDKAINECWNDCLIEEVINYTSMFIYDQDYK